MKIVWTQLAVNDLYSLQEYIAEDNPEAANQTLEKISNMTINIFLLLKKWEGQVGFVELVN